VVSLIFTLIFTLGNTGTTPARAAIPRCVETHYYDGALRTDRETKRAVHALAIERMTDSFTRHVVQERIRVLEPRMMRHTPTVLRKKKYISARERARARVMALSIVIGVALDPTTRNHSLRPLPDKALSLERPHRQHAIDALRKQHSIQIHCM
jgi:hypothetical protein